MSVIRFEVEKIKRLEAEVQGALEHGFYDHAIERVVRNSHRFCQQWWWQGKLKKDTTEAEVMQETVGRLFWYCAVANRIAHALQYREEPELFVDADEWDVETHALPPSNANQLRSDLSHLRYNLLTNDGNLFLAEEWRELFDNMVEALGDYIISSQLGRARASA